MSCRHLSITGISQLLLTWFWPNFKCRFTGQSLTDANCYGGICPGNICLGDICSYQQYLLLTRFWTNFLEQFLGGLNFCRPNLFGLNVFGPNLFFEPRVFWTNNFFDLKFFCSINLGSKNYWVITKFLTPTCSCSTFWANKKYKHKISFKSKTNFVQKNGVQKIYLFP